MSLYNSNKNKVLSQNNQRKNINKGCLKLKKKELWRESKVNLYLNKKEI